MAHSTLMGNDATLGPLQSFRCTRFGVTCDQATSDMNQVGPKSGCRSNETGEYLMPISSYASVFRGLKSDPRNVMMAAIVGDPSPVAVELRVAPGGGSFSSALAHACEFRGTVGTEVADPAVRLGELTSKFSRGMVETACTPDLRGAASRIARQVRTMVGDSCLARDIAMPADCHVFDTRSGSEVMLPACSGATFADCYSLVFDPKCSAPQYLRVEVNRNSLASPDTMVSVRCKL